MHAVCSFPGWHDSMCSLEAACSSAGDIAHSYAVASWGPLVQGLPTIESKVEMAIQLKGHVVAYVLNSHGNHVVQCCITHIPSAENGHSIEFMLEVRRSGPVQEPPWSLPCRGGSNMLLSSNSDGNIGQFI